MNAESSWGVTPFYEAINRTANRGLLELLLRHGADIQVRLRSGWTPLHEAAHNGNPPWIAEFLLDKERGYSRAGQ